MADKNLESKQQSMGSTPMSLISGAVKPATFQDSRQKLFGGKEHETGEREFFRHGEMDADRWIPQAQEMRILSQVEDHMSRFYTVLEILGRGSLKDPPLGRAIPLLKGARGVEDAATHMRDYFNAPMTGPLWNLSHYLEERGLVVCPCAARAGGFVGVTGFAGERPYVAFNQGAPLVKIRFALSFQTAKFMFDWSTYEKMNKSDQMAAAIAAAFLLPEADIKKVLGDRRRGTWDTDKSFVTSCLRLCCDWGVSPRLVALRVKSLKLITPLAARILLFKLKGAKRNAAKSDLEREENPLFLDKLVFTAVVSGKLSAVDGSQILGKPYTYVEEMCKDGKLF